jgi:adenosylmethionine-8-amino-7-oxononanoate aminotransferase
VNDWRYPAGYAPLGAALMPARLVEELPATCGFTVFHSYDANPIACAAGAAVLHPTAHG